MATEKVLETYAAVAAADLSAKVNYFAAVGASGMDVCGDGAVGIGSIWEGAPSGYPATAVIAGIAKVIAAETIAVGARVASDSTGKAVVAAVGDFEFGTCVEGGDANEVISYIIAPGRRHA